MKRTALCLLAAVLLLSGCAATREDPFRVDTVVRIPVDPTQAPTEAPTEVPTAPPTEAVTEAPTEPLATEAPKKTSSSKGSSGKSSSGKPEKTKATEPPATDAPTDPPLPASYDPSAYSIGSLEYDLLDAINAYRIENGAGELSINGRLSGIAYVRAREGVAAWSHTRPDGSSYTSALSDYGYSYGAVTELMVRISGSDANAVMEKWRESKSHSKSLLSSDYDTVGIGIFYSGGRAYLVCLLVG